MNNMNNFYELFEVFPSASTKEIIMGYENKITKYNNIKKLSKVVLTNFKPMIPAAFHKVWEQGLLSNDYYLKLCGSGGGGYILGFTEDFDKAKASLKDIN